MSNEMQERLNAMEERWTKANQNQKASIDRLLKQRQAALDLLHSATPMQMEFQLRDQIVRALNGDLS